MSQYRVLLLVVTAFALGGCAHPIQVSPTTAKVARTAESPLRVPASVGLYIPAEATAREVTTAGGGGDKTRYFPYRDIEASYETMLYSVFENVVRLKSATDAEAIKKANITYVVTPVIVTTSSSPSLFTWPPTVFTVDLTTDIADAAGKVVASPRVIGNGAAEFSEFKADFGLAGKRAMEDALVKMQRMLFDTSYPSLGHRADSSKDTGVKTTVSSASPLASTIVKSSSPVAERLKALDQLFQSSAISKEEYESKRKDILNAL